MSSLPPNSPDAVKALELFELRYEQAERLQRTKSEERSSYKRALKAEDVPVSIPEGAREDNDRLPTFRRYIEDHLELMKAHFANADFGFDAEPAEPGDDERARVIGETLNFFGFATGLADAQVEIVTPALESGLTVVKTWWKKDVRLRRVPRRRNFREVIAGVEQAYDYKPEVMYNGPAWSLVDLEDFFPNPAATDRDNLGWVIHRVWLSAEQLEERAEKGIYSNIDEVFRKLGREGSGDTYGEGSADVSEDRRLRTDGLFPVFEMHTNTTLTTIIGDIVVRHCGNPCNHLEIPFLIGNTRRQNWNIWGRSEIEPLIAAQDAAHTDAYQRNDMINLQIDPVFLVNEELESALEFTYGPGARVPVGRNDDVKLLDLPTAQNAALLLQNEEYWQREMEKISGMTETMAGTASSSNATQAANNAEAGTKRLELRLNNMDYLYRRIGEQWLSMCQQFLTEEMLVEIVGDDGDAKHMRIDGPAMRGKFRVQIRAGAERLKRDAEIRKMLELISQLQPLMQMGLRTADGRMLDIEYAVRRLLELNKINPDKFFKQQAPGAMAQQLITSGSNVDPNLIMALSEKAGLAPGAPQGAMPAPQEQMQIGAGEPGGFDAGALPPELIEALMAQQEMGGDEYELEAEIEPAA